MSRNNDYADDDNIFSEDYMTDRLFEEEDEELGIDVHEIDLGSPQKAAYVREEYSQHGSIEGLPDTHVIRKKLTPKMKSKGFKRVIIFKGNKKVIFT